MTQGEGPLGVQGFEIRQQVPHSSVGTGHTRQKLRRPRVSVDFPPTPQRNGGYSRVGLKETEPVSQASERGRYQSCLQEPHLTQLVRKQRQEPGRAHGVLSLCQSRATPSASSVSLVSLGNRRAGRIPAQLPGLSLTQWLLQKGLAPGSTKEQVSPGSGRKQSKATHIIGCNVLDGVLHAVIHHHHCHPSSSDIVLPDSSHVDVSARPPPIIL